MYNQQTVWSREQGKTHLYYEKRSVDETIESWINITAKKLTWQLIIAIAWTTGTPILCDV